MMTLVTALFVEGRTDERFLPVLIQRVIETLILQRGRGTTDVLEPILVQPAQSYTNNAERVLLLARQTSGFYTLIVHCDADYPSEQRALDERFLPGQLRVEQAQQAGQDVCKLLIPLIPVQMIEAWMLADPVTLHRLIGTRLRLESLPVPQHPHQVESLPNPKQTLLDFIRQALADRPRRRRDAAREVVILQEQLAREIRLELLRAVPAFARFEERLTVALQELHLLEH